MPVIDYYLGLSTIKLWSRRRVFVNNQSVTVIRINKFRSQTYCFGDTLLLFTNRLCDVTVTSPVIIWFFTIRL